MTKDEFNKAVKEILLDPLLSLWQKRFAISLIKAHSMPREKNGKFSCRPEGIRIASRYVKVVTHPKYLAGKKVRREDNG